MRQVLLALFFSQSLLLPKPSTIQHIDVATSANSATVAKGSMVTLWADVTPKPNIHVYATDKYGFSPVALVMAKQSQVAFGALKYSPPEAGISPGTDALIPMYSKPFRITQSATVSASAKSGEVITIAGTVNYEACNDRLCFPAASLPVTWTVTVK